MKYSLIPATMCMPLLAGLVFLGGCGEKSSHTAEASTTAPVVEAQAPVPPKHFYAIEDEGGYGYEKAISQEEQKQGRAAAEVLTFYYLGHRGNVHQVMMKDGRTRVVTECALPCEYAKIYAFWGDEFTNKQIVKISPDALLKFVFDDVSNGDLKQYTGKQQGKPVQFWVDGESKRLTVSAVDPL